MILLAEFSVLAISALYAGMVLGGYCTLAAIRKKLPGKLWLAVQCCLEGADDEAA